MALGLPFTAPLATDEEVVRIEVPEEMEKMMISEELWDPEEWQTFLEWFKDTMLVDREEAVRDAESRKSKVGLSRDDFNEVVYRSLLTHLPLITTWWEKNRPKPSQVFESEYHVVFVSDILEFAWHMMPLSDGTPIGANYSIGVQPRGWETPPASGNDACIHTTGNIINKDGAAKLLGQGWLFKIASGASNTGESGSLLVRALRQSGMDSGFESMSTEEKEEYIRGQQTQNKLTKMTDLACRLHGSNSVCLPSFWLHEGHGYAGSLQLQDESSIRAKEIRDFIADTEGTIDIAWLCSCHSAETASETSMFNPDNPKVRAFLGHLGMGDESVSVLAFEFTVMSDILNGHSIGNAVYRARRAARPGCSSGSYILLGDPRVILCPRRQ